MRTVFTAICLIGAVGTATAEALPEPLEALLTEARNDCAGLEGGTLSLEDGAITRVDLTGDGAEDWALDYFHLHCSSAASLFCGTGGCGLSVLVGDHLANWLTKGWDVADLGPYRVVLTQVHGSACGGTNLTPCVEAHVWDPAEARFTTARPLDPDSGDGQ